MTLKEKIVFAAYLTTSVAIVAHAATEIYVTFKRSEPLRNQIKEAKKNA